jgi:hypothetical protein
MKIRTTLALAVTTLTLGVPVATATPDGYQPDAVDSYVANGLVRAGESDAFARYLGNHANGIPPSLDSTGASLHPDSLAVRPGLFASTEPAEAERLSWAGVAFGTLGGALIVLLAFAGAHVRRERRRLVLS